MTREWIRSETVLFFRWFFLPKKVIWKNHPSVATTTDCFEPIFGFLRSFWFEKYRSASWRRIGMFSELSGRSVYNNSDHTLLFRFHMKLTSLWLALLNWYVGTLARASKPADWDVLRHVNLLGWLKFKVQNFSLFSDVQAFRSLLICDFGLQRSLRPLEQSTSYQSPNKSEFILRYLIKVR